MTDPGAPPAPVNALPIPRDPKSRVSAGWVVMLLAGMVAFLVFLVVTRPAESVQVAVARASIGSSTVFSSDQVSYRSLSIPSGQVKGLVTKADVDKLDGRIMERGVDKGAVLTHRDFAAATSKKTLRTMSIDVDPKHANGGKLAVGDRIDIIDTGDVIEYAVTDLEVVDINKGGRGSLGVASNSFILTVAATDVQTIRIASATDDGRFEVIRATGSQPLDAEDLARLNAGSESNASEGEASDSDASTSSTTLVDS